MRLVTRWFGTFLVEQDGTVVDRIIFPEEPEEIARRLARMESGEVLAEEMELAAGRELVVGEARLRTLGRLEHGPEPDIRPEAHGVEPGLLARAMVLRGREKVRESASPDEQVVQAIRAIDDLTGIINLMSERLHEWHALNFPELASMVSEVEYVKLIAEHGDRESMAAAGMVEPVDSLGVEIAPADREAVMSLARCLNDCQATRDDLERYVESRMREIAPNLSHVAGALIGARLMSLTGGLKRLASLPSSTVQLLGAEKALFKHLKDSARPPKHGVIFQHPMVHRAPPWQRGKIARAFAGKIALAARIDYYGKGFKGDELEADLKRRVEDIKRRYPGPRKGKRGQKKK